MPSSNDRDRQHTRHGGGWTGKNLWALTGIAVGAGAVIGLTCALIIALIEEVTQQHDIGLPILFIAVISLMAGVIVGAFTGAAAATGAVITILSQRGRRTRPATRVITASITAGLAATIPLTPLALSWAGADTAGATVLTVVALTAATLTATAILVAERHHRRVAMSAVAATRVQPERVG